MVSMTTILVRCSVHAQLTHDAFSVWLERRRRGMGRATGGVRAVEARRLGDQDLVIELHCGPGDDVRSSPVVRDFIGDLQLMGMGPRVYLPEANASQARTRGSMRRTTTMTSPNRTMS
jgi:hypothetical protein